MPGLICMGVILVNVLLELEWVDQNCDDTVKDYFDFTHDAFHLSL